MIFYFMLAWDSVCQQQQHIFSTSKEHLYICRRQHWYIIRLLLDCILTSQFGGIRWLGRSYMHHLAMEARYMHSKCILEVKCFFLSVCITVVGTGIRLHIGCFGVLSLGRDRKFSHLQTSRVALGPTKLSVQ